MGWRDDAVLPQLVRGLGVARTMIRGTCEMTAVTIRKELHIDAAREVVFDALTCSEEIVKYFPLKEVVSEWKVDGEVLYKGEVDGAAFTDYGVIEVLLRPEIYRYRYWSDNHGTERTPENHISIAYELSADGDGTMLQLEQSNLKSRDLYEIMDTVVWDALLGSLKNYVESSG